MDYPPSPFEIAVVVAALFAVARWLWDMFKAPPPPPESPTDERLNWLYSQALRSLDKTYGNNILDA